MTIKMQNNGLNGKRLHITLESHESGIDIIQDNDCVALDDINIDTMIKNLQILKLHIKSNQ